MKISLKGLPKSTVDLLLKYGLITDRRGTLQQTTLEAEENGAPLGTGPLVAPSVLERILDADKSPDKHWVPWMLYLAGGGAEAERASADLLEHGKGRWFDQHLRGWRDKNGEYHKPMTREAAEKLWEKEKEEGMESLVANADQDLVLRFQCFGWYRNWPGCERRYERVTTAVNDFFKLQRKVLAMNDWLKRNGRADDQVSLDPDDYGSPEALMQALLRVKRFFASRKARTDIRVDRIYEDENVRILAPLTYAAAVRLGWQTWPFADREVFNRGLESGLNKMEDAWRNGSQANAYVYIHMKSPVPSWIGRSGNIRYYYTNLALEIPFESLRRGDISNARVYDEENNRNQTLDSVLLAIKNEPHREYDPEKEEEAVNQGPPVYGSQEEADAVLNSLTKGLQAVKQWGRTFDTGRLVPHYMPQ